MKILQINKFFYHQGGTETYLFALINLLKKRGHEIIGFSQNMETSLKSISTEYFISNINLEKFNWPSLFKIGRIFWSFEAIRKIKKLIKNQKPEIAHIHNIYHQISPSILPIIKRAGIPMVMTVHDFKLIKPDYTLRADDKKIMPKNSWLVNLLLKTEFNFHKILKNYQRHINLFIVPSEFVKKQLIKNKFKAEKIKILPHFIDLTKYPKPNNDQENYILYFGRLNENKGVDTLINAFLKIANNDNITLKIVGLGPQELELKKIAKHNQKIEFLGKRQDKKLIAIIQNSLFTVFPSRVHETFGLGILESYACKKPVIASRVGAFPEIVIENQTGILFEVNNENQLKRAMEFMINNPNKTKRMGEIARQIAEIKYNPEKHYQRLMKIYENLILK